MRSEKPVISLMTSNCQLTIGVNLCILLWFLKCYSCCCYRWFSKLLYFFFSHFNFIIRSVLLVSLCLSNENYAAVIVPYVGVIWPMDGWVKLFPFLFWFCIQWLNPIFNGLHLSEIISQFVVQLLMSKQLTR